MNNPIAVKKSTIEDQKSTIIVKVVAYVTRLSGSDTELLVFTHSDFPEAGVQVPAGTVEHGELPDVAVMRELQEETGKSGYYLIRRVASYEFALPTGDTCLRHVYHLSAPEGLPDRWRWGERFGTPEQITFDFYWAPLHGAPALAGGLGDHLRELAHA